LAIIVPDPSAPAPAAGAVLLASILNPQTEERNSGRPRGKRFQSKAETARVKAAKSAGTKRKVICCVQSDQAFPLTQDVLFVRIEDPSREKGTTPKAARDNASNIMNIYSWYEITVSN